MSRPRNTSNTTVSAPAIPAESIAIIDNVTPITAIDFLGDDGACKLSFMAGSKPVSFLLESLAQAYGIPSASLVERALKAASIAANANSAHGDMRAKMPIIQEALKDGKATKREGAFSVRDTEGVTRDASKLTPEQRKVYNGLVTTITAAKHLGILAAKVR